jgi:hypothetical protein
MIPYIIIIKGDMKMKREGELVDGSWYITDGGTIEMVPPEWNIKVNC